MRSTVLKGAGQWNSDKKRFAREQAFKRDVSIHKVATSSTPNFAATHIYLYRFALSPTEPIPLLFDKERKSMK